MPLRFTFPLLFFLAGCASTAVVPPVDEGPVGTPDATASQAPHGSGETIDDHLFIPDQEQAAVAVSEPEPERHVHPHVWERLVHSFALPDCSNREISQDWATWYAEHPDYMARVFRRAQPWIHFIAEEIEKRGLPGELALLPVVESAYDPFAYSRGAAVGAWQFIASTGRRYGLKQDWWYDGRRDVWASTHAALDYLTDLGEKFEGDWLLALAGYNAGENRVAREIRKNQARGKPADFWNISLPSETRGYVPKLLGLSCLVRDPDQYDFQLPATADRPVITVVDPEAQVDLVLVSQIAEVDIDVLFSLNPGFNRWATSPDGPHHVVLPTHGARKFLEKAEKIDFATLMKWDQVTVQEGDTLSHIANVHRVPVSVIRSANQLNGDLIRAGQKLRLPRDEQMLVDPLYASDAAELQRLQSGLIASDRLLHRVRRGESLSVIAQQYRVSVRELQAWNNISNPRALRAGRDLVVFRSPAPPKAVTRSGTVQHTVRSGDSLWSIARKYRVDLDDLMRWNGLGDNTIIQPGQSLKILF